MGVVENVFVCERSMLYGRPHSSLLPNRSLLVAMFPKIIFLQNFSQAGPDFGAGVAA